MDDLLREFLTETNESLERVDSELVRFEREPNNANILGNIFRLVHTIKGTCGFLALPRLEALAHAAETLMGKFRDGMPVTADAVTLILNTIDRIKLVLDEIETQEKEPDGGDADLIELLGRRAAGEVRVAPLAEPAPLPEAPRAPAAVVAAENADPADAPEAALSQLPHDERGERVANHSIRVSVGTLDYLMTTVSELVLTRNQLLEIVRRHEDSDFKVPLQRLSNVTAELQEGVMKTRMQPIGNAWQKLPRIVRDLCGELGKEIELKMHGAETELDRQVLELVKDPLTHLVRNCADHGIEDPAARVAAGKPPRERSCCPLATRAATSSSRSPTMGAASILLASAPKRSRRALPAKPRSPPSPTPMFAISSLRPVSRPLRGSPVFPAAASAWMSCAAISSRSAVPSICALSPAPASNSPSRFR